MTLQVLIDARTTEALTYQDMLGTAHVFLKYLTRNAN